MRLQLAELVGRVVAHHRRRCDSVGRRYWPIVRMSTSIARRSRKHLDQLGRLLAEADHQAGLGRDVRRVGLGALEQLERARRTCRRCAPCDRGAARSRCCGSARRAARRAPSAAGPPCPGSPGSAPRCGSSGDSSRVRRMVSAKMPDAAVRQIVAIDRRDDDVVRGPASRTASATRRGSSRSSVGRLAVRHGAVAAGARADVAEDHERGRAVVPALADVRAVRLLADGVQPEVPHQLVRRR